MCGFLGLSSITSRRQFSSAKFVFGANRVAQSLRVSSSVRTIDPIHLLEKKGSRSICHLPVLSLRCAALKIFRRTRFLVAGFALAVAAGWFYWNWPRRVDMAAYVPADCVAFAEADALVELAEGIGASEAWTKMAAPL